MDILDGKRLTQARLAELLEETTGVQYSGVNVSYWETGARPIPIDDRRLLVSLIEVLNKCGGIHTLEEANELLLSGNYRQLSEQEIQTIKPTLKSQLIAEGTVLHTISITNRFLIEAMEKINEVFGTEQGIKHPDIVIEYVRVLSNNYFSLLKNEEPNQE